MPRLEPRRLRPREGEDSSVMELDQVQNPWVCQSQPCRSDLKIPDLPSRARPFWNRLKYWENKLSKFGSNYADFRMVL